MLTLEDLFFFFQTNFLLDIFFIYISNAIPFPSFLSKIPYTLSLPPAPQPTHSQLPGPGIPLTVAYNICKTKGLSSQ